MKIIFITTNDPIYLPDFFSQYFQKNQEEIPALYVTSPLYKNQTRLNSSWKFYRTFGFHGVFGLLRHLLASKLKGISISKVCRRFSIPSEHILDINSEDFLHKLENLKPDLIVSVSCPQIFKKKLIQIPPLGCLNIHGAVLPHYRGCLPSFWMLANEEKQAGVTVHYINEKIDAGEICGQQVFDISPEETVDSLIRKSKSISADLLCEVIQSLKAGSLKCTPLNVKEGSYYSWPDAAAVKSFYAKGKRLW